MKKLTQNIKTIPLIASLALNPLNKCANAHPEQSQRENTVTQDSKAFELMQQSTSENTTCHQIINSHQLCISNHSQQIDPQQIASRFKESLKLVYQTLNIPEKLQTSKTDTTLLIIAASQQELEILMNKIDIQSSWGYFLENLIPNINVAISYADHQRQITWENSAHELTHAIFSLTIGDHIESKEFCEKHNINHKLIWEGFAEFFQYINTLESDITIQGLPQNLVNHLFQFPDNHNTSQFLKAKTYSISELLSYKPRPDSDNYVYGKVFFAFLHHKHPRLFKLILLSIRTKSDAGISYFLEEVNKPEINQDFQAFQKYYQFINSALRNHLTNHILQIYNNHKQTSTINKPKSPK